MAEFFFVVFLEEKRILKVLSKIVENKTVFCSKNVFKPREQKQKKREFFPTFQDKNLILIFWIHQKGEKRETELKRRIKKRRVI